MNKCRVSSLVMFIAIGVSGSVAANPWNWSVAPYLWGADISLDQTVDDQSSGITVRFRDLVDKLDTAFMIHVEGGPQDSPFGFLFDAAYVDVSDSRTPPPDLGLISIDGAVKLQIYELAATYTPGTVENLDLIIGLRRFDLRTTTDLSVIDQTSQIFRLDEDFNDALIGLRWRNWLSDTWDYRLRADISFGDTDMSWSANAGVAWHFGSRKNMQLLGGYRHMDIDFGTNERMGEPTQTELTLSGPYLAINFDF